MQWLKVYCFKYCKRSLGATAPLIGMVMCDVFPSGVKLVRFGRGSGFESDGHYSESNNKKDNSFVSIPNYRYGITIKTLQFDKITVKTKLK